MGCSVCLWLVVSFCRVWGMGRGTRETVLGTLGKATVLWIPQEFQTLTQSFGVATWKRDTEDPHSKDVLLKYLGGNYTNYNPSQNRFHSSNFSLEILSTKRQDQRLYEYIISKDAEEKVWQIQLEVYEPVSDPDIQVLSWALANDSCTVTLNCTAARGDNVSYSWTGLEASTSSPCAHNGSLLHLSYHLNATGLACACTASNPVSSSAVTFNSSACSFEQRGSARPGLNLVLVVVVVPAVVVLVLIVVFTAKHMGRQREHAPFAQDSEVHTIYSQVQRVEKQKIPCSPPRPEHPSCTTIYAAATGLPPDTAQAPGRIRHSPRAEPPTPRGRSPLSQSPEAEPTTVYACVTLPMI
ncbi:signaling lymphocytic activation molecule-like isoform X2 [Oxyura jamaicensis]|uniref:signaling lymphocytic activation molecule-like isoform X2 n=1 Tax=Oxyura jamaicensis TaxID=8884 RepID=UPI0015A52641|nr:signaling lymphocytic activation molecule-like isoform X2 [Oxyura jamaicensis]